MKSAFSKAGSRAWKGVSAEERSRILSERAKKGWANKSKAERSEQARKLNAARWGKKDAA